MSGLISILNQRVNGDVLKPSHEQKHLYDDTQWKRREINGATFHEVVGHDVLNGEYKDPLAMFIFFHPGALNTGNPQYEPWWQPHVHELTRSAITVFPDYPLLPPSNGTMIFESVNQFWNAYTSTEYQEDLKRRFPTICTQRLMVGGSSAGGMLAVWSWLLRKDLNIHSMVLFYPMTRAYTRSARQEYMGLRLSDEQHYEDAMQAVISILKTNQMPLRVGDEPPRGMDYAFLLSSTMVKARIDGSDPVLVSWWRVFFKCWDVHEIMLKRHDVVQPQGHVIELNVEELWDRLGEDGRSNAKERGITFCLPSSLCYSPDRPHAEGPGRPLFVDAVHGTEDGNCPLQDTEKLISIAQSLFPGYKDNFRCYPVEGKRHAFDYELRLPGFIENVKQRWLQQDHAEA